jgi:hypothetical protein
LDTKKIIDKAGADRTASALQLFLDTYLNPAFGSLPKGETELLVLRLLTDLGAIEKKTTVYELASQLKVTRAKARKLIYDQDLRHLTSEELDDEIRALLRHPKIQKSGEVYILEVENPLVSDHLRARVQKLGHISDGSFSPSIVKLTLEAMTSLVESCLKDEDKQVVQKALIAAGAPNTSIKGALKAVLKKIGEKIADSTGEAIAEQASDYLEPIIGGVADVIKSKALTLFTPVKP